LLMNRSYDRTLVVKTRSSLLLKIILQMHKHYNYLQSLLNRKFFKKVIQNVKLEGFG
jgi:hypothetical protein